MTVDEALSFEEAYRRLQETVEELENGALPLEESLALYERGMDLIALCARHLAEAEVRLVEIDSALGAALSALDEPPVDEEGLGDAWEETRGA